MVFLLILESLGSTELFFILVMALVFFGPRKLPQLSRSLGKNLATFRRVSDDFKRTWDREVTMEELGVTEGNSILHNPPTGQSVQAPTIQSISPDRVVARETAADTPAESQPATPEPPPPPAKHDWL